MSASRPRGTKNSQVGRSSSDPQAGSSSQEPGTVAVSGAQAPDMDIEQNPDGAPPSGSSDTGSTVEGVGNTLIIEAMRTMLGDFRQHVDLKFAEQQQQIRRNQDGLALLTQTVTTLQEQVQRIEKRSESRGRCRSASSRASSMPEGQKLARRAEKRPEILVPAQPPSPEPKAEVSPVPVSVLDDIAAFTGTFTALPFDLYESGKWNFSVSDFMAAQPEVHVFRTNSESKAKWRARTFAAIAAHAQRRADRTPVHRFRGATGWGSGSAPLTVEPPPPVRRMTSPPRESVPALSPTIPKEFYAALHARSTVPRRLMSEPPRLSTPAPALRAQTETRTLAPAITFTADQLDNIENAHPLDARLLRALYSFENAHIGKVPVKMNLKIDLPSYAGANDFAMLEDFLNLFYEWLEVQGLTDAKNLAQACSAFGHALKDDARRWYSMQRNLYVQSGSPWYFDQIIVALRQYFIFETAESEALEEFKSIRLGPGGVIELRNKLERAAGYLVEHPTPYGMRTQFLDALPEAFARRLVSKGFTAERRSLEELKAET